MAHYYDEVQTTPLRKEEIRFTYKGYEFTVVTAGGVFSKRRLDRGTATMLEAYEYRDGERVLDLGCGWGAVGLVLKTIHPDLILTLTDVNPRAILLARENFARISQQATFVVSDGFAKITGDFDAILLNPPMAAGRKVCYDLITHAASRLHKGGRLYVVARHNKGGAMLEKHMSALFTVVETLNKSGGFRTYRGVKS